MALALRPRTALVLSLPRTVIASLVLFSFLCLASPLMPSRADEPLPQSDPIAITEQTMLTQINTVRASHGLPPFELDTRLAQSAEQHAHDMQQHATYSHRGTDGSSPRIRVERTGYVPANVTEAIGWGYNVENMLTWWLNSPVHRPIILSTTHRQIGIAFLGNPGNQRSSWWVLNAATHK